LGLAGTDTRRSQKGHEPRPARAGREAGECGLRTGSTLEAWIPACARDGAR
jgi:hypothetical protein